jgi:hypothetical protein
LVIGAIVEVVEVWVTDVDAGVVDEVAGSVRWSGAVEVVVDAANVVDVLLVVEVDVELDVDVVVVDVSAVHERTRDPSTSLQPV